MRNMTLLVVAIIAIAFCPDKVQSLDDPPSFDITYIKFNYESGYTDDALTIKVNASENIHIPEWHWWYVTLYDEEIAYIRTQSSRKVIFSVWIQTEEYIPGVMIRAVKTSGTGMGNINNTEVYFDSDSAFSHATTGTISGSVPSTVGKRDFTWEWEVTQIYLGEGGGEEEWEDLEEAISVGTTGPHDYYTVIDEPQDPMEVPWTEVLDFSCDWASGENSISGALEELTQELYSSGVEYEGGAHYTTPSYTNLNLTELLDDLSNPSNVQMDCRDFSNFIQVLLNSLGGECEYNRIDRTTSPYWFTYNYILPAGASSWTTGNWNYHQIGWYDSKVADASTQIDNDADPTSSPHTAKLAVGDMTLSAYIDKLTETSNVSSVATGTCTVY